MNRRIVGSVLGNLPAAAQLGVVRRAGGNRETRVYVVVGCLRANRGLGARFENQDDVRVRGTYSNYRLCISRYAAGRAGWISGSGSRSKPRFRPDSESKAATFGVDASYNALLWKSLDEAADAQVSFLREDGLER